MKGAVKNKYSSGDRPPSNVAMAASHVSVETNRLFRRV
jgi:hypothetical protein